MKHHLALCSTKSGCSVPAVSSYLNLTRRLSTTLCIIFFLVGIPQVALAQEISISVQPDAGHWETKAAADLGKYIHLMTGRNVEKSASLVSNPNLSFVVGELALKSKPELRRQLKAIQKKNPTLRADAIVSVLEGKTVYLAGSNDDSHYFAVSKFLHDQGCRWYMPNEFGECIPRRETLDLSKLGWSYAPSFEIRRFWISWNGDDTGHEEFAHRNFYNQDNSLSPSHELGNIINENKLLQSYQFGSAELISALAQKLAPDHKQSLNLSFGIADAVQTIRSSELLEFTGNIEDKFFNNQVTSDLYLKFYNDLCSELWRRSPESRSKVSFLAYVNLTLPPQRSVTVAQPLVCFLAPIDIDPNHSFESKVSPEKRDYLGAARGWTEVMKGRVVIYDYDQGMLVWRDLPNPSHQVFREDVMVYRDLGILGFSTESRGALATTFTNMFFRGQLMWNPDFDVDLELALFYQNFYGPTAPEMKNYWSDIYQAWAETTTVFHESIAIADIYRRPLVERLRRHMEAARAKTADLTSSQKERLEFTELSFELIDLYNQMERAAATEGDYTKAVVTGRTALAVREKLTAMNPTFTTYKKMPENGPGWWPGEVDYYAQLAALTDGRQGKLVRWLDLDWKHKLDPNDVGIWRRWAAETDLSNWKILRSDHTTRAQGLFDSEGYSPEGYLWYATELKLSAAETQGNLRLNFPGIFNESWLYIDGKLVHWRQQKPLWWQNDYSFQWDADLTARLKPGKNRIFVRTRIHQNPSGMFRRPFLYRKN